MRFTRVMILGVALAAAVGAAVLAGVVHAQGAKVTINDPVGPPPDPTHIPTVLPKDIKWTGTPGRQETAILRHVPGLAAERDRIQSRGRFAARIEDHGTDQGDPAVQRSEREANAAQARLAERLIPAG